jgi:hypothetical protein
LFQVLEAPEEEDPLLSSGQDKIIRLVESERLKVFEEQVLMMLKMSKGRGISLAELPAIFAENHGYTLDPAEYGASSLDEVIFGLRHLKVHSSRRNCLLSRFNY